jgi:hypothetical protein
MLAWHYTTGEKFEEIVAAGFLRPTSMHIGPSERPILWFSLNQGWEQTANKGWEERGVRRRLTMEETRVKGRGLARFGIDARRLIPWPKLGRKARMSPETMGLLMEGAAEVGANPYDWLGTFARIELTGLVISVVDDGEWAEIRRPTQG